MPKRDWRDDAYCIDMPSHIFYGKTEDSMTAAEITSAKNVCLKCPVQRDCLIYALKKQEPYGVWGGFAPFERRTALKRNSGEYIYAVADYDNGEFIKPRTRKK